MIRSLINIFCKTCTLNVAGCSIIAELQQGVIVDHDFKFVGSIPRTVSLTLYIQDDVRPLQSGNHWKSLLCLVDFLYKAKNVGKKAGIINSSSLISIKGYRL